MSPGPLESRVGIRGLLTAGRMDLVRGSEVRAYSLLSDLPSSS